LQLSLVWNARGHKQAQPGLSRLVKELAKKEPELFAGIWVNYNEREGNAILNTKKGSWERVWGGDFIKEPVALSAPPAPPASAPSLHFLPSVFRQGNYAGFNQIALAVAEILSSLPAPPLKVTELYAGVGLLGLTAYANSPASFSYIRCSDANPDNVRCFRKNVASLSAAGHAGAEAAVSYRPLDAAAALAAGECDGSGVVVVDPPRAGLDEEVLEALCGERGGMEDADTLVYVSCGFKALAQDLERMFKSGAGWKVARCEGYVLFPGSDHVETLVVLKKGGAAGGEGRGGGKGGGGRKGRSNKR
jgi:hypothetical protein